MKRFWNYFFAEPFHWIFLAFFQFRRLERELGPVRLLQRFYLVLRTSLPTIFLIYPTAVLIRILLINLHVFPYIGIVSLLLDTFILSIIGVAFGVAFGVLVVDGVAFGVTLGVAFGVTLGVAVGVLVVDGVAVEVVVGVVVGVAFGVALGVGANSIFIGVISGFSFLFCYFVSFFRLPFYFVSAPSALRAYLASRKSPDQVLTLLQRSSLHWDELVYLRLPYLKKMLLLAYQQDSARALEEISFIAAERPLQIWAAQGALIEIAVSDLAQRTTLTEIATVVPFLDRLFPQEAKLLAPQWAAPLTNLREASQDALRFSSPVGHQAKLEALQDMTNHLKRVHLSSSFGNAQLSSQLNGVVSLWLAIAKQEQTKLLQLPEYLGRIYNPYNPGNAMKPNDPLFFGRRDLVLMLEEELAKGDRRPTFLMTGERRMGKSSTLLQLPYRLGSRFLPVFYDLQSSGILTSTSIFLSSIADGIVRVMREHDLSVRGLEYRAMRDFGKQSYLAETFDSYSSPSDESPSSVFYLFEQWFRGVEGILEKENRTLLLLFDEFEKLDSAEQKRNFDLPLLLDWFRNLIQYHPRVALLFSGIHNFGEMGRERNLNWSGYFVNVQTLHVSFLQADEARRLITRPVADFPGDEIYGEGVVEGIIEQTGCHPFLVQAICSTLIDQLNVQKKPRAELSDLESAIELTFSNWDNYFRDLWVRTDEPQRLCLIFLLKSAPASLDQIQQQSDLERKHVRQTLQILLSRDLVSEDGSGLYHISTPLFRRWVERFAEV